MELVSSMKNNDNIARGDNYNAKGSCINYSLARMCQESNILYLGNSNISLEHIQRGEKFGGIHLNERGVDVFKQNFIKVINH